MPLIATHQKYWWEDLVNSPKAVLNHPYAGADSSSAFNERRIGGPKCKYLLFCPLDLLGKGTVVHQVKCDFFFPVAYTTAFWEVPQ